MFKRLSGLVIRFSSILKCLENRALVYTTWCVGADRTENEIYYSSKFERRSHVLEAIYEIKHFIFGDFWIFLLKSEGLHWR
jgi:hypothetical protein